MNPYEDDIDEVNDFQFKFDDEDFACDFIDEPTQQAIENKQYNRKQKNNSTTTLSKKSKLDIEITNEKTSSQINQIEIKQEIEPLSSNLIYDTNEIITVTVDDNIQVESVGYYLNEREWLMGRHIDKALDFIESQTLRLGNLNMLIWNIWKIDDSIRNRAHIHENSENDQIFIVKNVHWIPVTNKDPVNQPKDMVEQW
ncbi:unnamed protein product [Brachionus calyciflorus]|uniref:Uncharacterized protein n=1 Tax=Brachionus calyciflorus TaxID=104777 RepID=A0A813Z3N9_9BILA|nr:unnamed protein product [Brachionus calyciflorus]